MAGQRTLRVLCLVTLTTRGASNRFRIEQYVPLLRQLGIDLQISAFFDERGYDVLYRRGHVVAKCLAVARGLIRRVRDLWRARAYDIVVVHRESAPIGPPLFERILRRWKVPYTFDFDDAIFLGPIDPANRRWSWLRHPSRVAESVRGAAAITAGNDYLAEWARQYNPSVTVIPTAVDVEAIKPRPPSATDGVVIGWIGSKWTTEYLRILDEPLDVLTRRRPHVRLRVVGGDYSHARARVEVRPFSLERESDDVASFDIGVLPEPDDPWTRGKCAFKALQYMAAGLPVVASRVGVNDQIVTDGRTGFCVGDVSEWVRALECLTDDPALRERFGREGRRVVEERYSTAVQAPRFAAVLRNAARTGS